MATLPARPRGPARGAGRRRRRCLRCRTGRCSATSTSRSETSSAAEAFWVDGLGLDAIVRGYPGALFVSAGGYHHHVGLNTWAGVGAPSPPEGARGLDRFEIVVPDEASVSAVREGLGAGAYDSPEDGVTATDPSGNAVLIRLA